ncbi:SDR family NAD(P)-dependent oxidoreductase [uncultured Anaerovibrio sp.]|uniref:SDR family NAD(P)-dependent oxidoreductase n=1 Tax=uncultured Anaerovibrio sp. TaxID=361586 RepID=UPI00260B652C|nr:SDR family oxidoreductase [uncultured Anaerovibrio sp.]
MNGKTVLITGGTSGIGLACAIIFFRQGHNVAVIGRNAERGISAVKEIASIALQGKNVNESADALAACWTDVSMGKIYTLYGKRIYYLQGDIRKYEDCVQAVNSVVEEFGAIDILVNSAGVYMEKSLDDMTEADYSLIMDTNIKGTYFMTQQAAERMKKRNNGAIINISSDAGVQGNMLCSAYCASKGAVNMFTKAMALELAPWSIRVNCVCPGDVMTPLTERQLAQYPDREAALKEMEGIYPLKRLGTPAEIAAVVAFLASDKAGFINGAIWSVDGGITA